MLAWFVPVLLDVDRSSVPANRLTRHKCNFSVNFAERRQNTSYVVRLPAGRQVCQFHHPRIHQ